MSSGTTTAADASTTTGADRVESPFAAPYGAVTIGMVALMALCAFEALAVTTTMPTVVAALGGLGMYAMAFAGPMSSGLVGMVAGGVWSDRRGPVRPLCWGVGLFVAGLVVAGSATAMVTVVAGRVVQGLGSGMLIVALYVLLARVIPASAQPRLFAAFAAAWVLPAVVGPAIAGAIAEHLGWRWVFLAVPLLAVPALLLLRPTLRSASARPAAAEPAGTPDDAVADDVAPGHIPPGAGRGDAVLDGPVPAAGADARPAAPDAPDAPAGRARMLRALGAGTGLLMLQLGGQAGGLRAAVLVAAGVTLLAVTVRSLLPAGTLRAARGIPAVMVVRGLLAAAFFGAEVYLPLLLSTERGLSPARAGLALTAGALTWSTGSWIRGRVEGRWDNRTVLRAGGLLIVAGVVLAGLAVWPAFPVVASVVGWGAAGLGMGLSYPTLSLLTLRLSPVAEQGANSSALQVSESLAIALTLAASGPAFALLVTARPTAAYLVTFAGSVVLAALAAVVAGRVPGRTAASVG